MPGSFALILHAHLPFVRHPEHDDFLEEEWLFAAITETYIPLLRILHRLGAEEIRFNLALSLTPTLGAMLGDELLQSRYLRHLERLIGLAREEVERNRNAPELAKLSRFYCDFFVETRSFYDEILKRDVVRPFRDLQDAGYLEIIGSAATHAFLPVFQDLPKAQRAQIALGCDSYREMFGRDPAGFWLPECGYSEGLDSILQDRNIRWFVLDSHGLIFGEPRPQNAIFAPAYTPAGPAVFARDRASNREVWSAQSGYPGDSVYLDFYRDIGFDRSEEELAPFLRPTGVRKFTGIKYHRVSAGGAKELYDPAVAFARADHDANDFFTKCANRLRGLEDGDFHPIVVSPFDAELFGHWWFEGPRFLESFVRRVAAEPKHFSLTTAAEYLERNPALQVVKPNPSSWGERGFSGVWLDDANAWIYPHLHAATRKMTELAANHRDTHDPAIERALRQAGRELLLAQASDWAFLIKTKSAPEYATRRTKEHLQHFNRLAAQIAAARIDLEFLGERKGRANLFPNLNWRYFL